MFIKQTQQKQHVADVYVTHCEPHTNDKWNVLINQMNNANLGQSPEWFYVIKKAYGHTPLYLQAENVEGQVAIIPAFLIHRPLFGRVIASMPFLDAGGPCSPSIGLARYLIDSLIKEATVLKASLIELRCTSEIDLPLQATGDKVNLVLPLPDDPDYLWQKLSAKVRNQVRKAMLSGLYVEFGGVEKLNDFYNIFAINMRDLGSPVHDRRFFSAIFDAFGNKARFALIYKGTIPIGGLVTLAFKNTIAVPWASSLRKYFSLCPNMLIYWETIRTACIEGFQRFDFGRSSRHSGTYHFKRQWGALEEPLFWYTLSIGSGRKKQLSSEDKLGNLMIKLWKHLPLSFTRWFGPYVRKYFTQ